MMNPASPRIRAHLRDIERYRRLLATHLTDIERDYVKRRIGEERAALLALKLGRSERSASPPGVSGNTASYTAL